jgi:L-rhamnose mutarotase
MTEGYKEKEYKQPVKRYVQTMELKDNPELIRRYRAAHQRENFWPEIKAGIREVGILEMEVYMIGTRLVLIVEAPLDFDWDTAMAHLATLPRQQEWEDYVAQFQKCASGETSDEKWKMMERTFYLYED